MNVCRAILGLSASNTLSLIDGLHQLDGMEAIVVSRPGTWRRQLHGSEAIGGSTAPTTTS